MISQGDFRRLLQASTKERKEIFTNIFGTWLYASLQNRLKENATALDKQMAEARRSIRQYTGGMDSAGNSDFSAEAQKAKKDGLPIAELLELFKKLLDEDERLKTRLDGQVEAVEKAITDLNDQIKAVEA